MDVYVDTAGQNLRVATNQKRFVTGTQNFIRFIFELSDDWAGLTLSAQFKQNGMRYNRALDSTNAVYLPTDIKAGEFTLALQGTDANKIAKTFEVKLLAIKDPFDEDDVKVIYVQNEKLILNTSNATIVNATLTLL